jgi:hypothetical protein
MGAILECPALQVLHKFDLLDLRVQYGSSDPHMP